MRVPECNNATNIILGWAVDGTAYSSESYRVQLEYGVLCIYWRQVDTICAGDNDILLTALNAGEWKRLDTNLA